MYRFVRGNKFSRLLAVSSENVSENRTEEKRERERGKIVEVVIADVIVTVLCVHNTEKLFICMSIIE